MPFFTHLRSLRLGIWATLLWASSLYAQTPTDGIMMGKTLICNVASYSNSQWDQYWEGTLKRRNANLGTFTSQNVMLMSAYGLTKNLNIMAGLPYIWNKSDGGHFSRQEGIQDLSLWLKYRPLKAETSIGTFGLMATGGVSIPMNTYIPDMLPYSIGLRSKTASIKGIFHYKIKGIYLTAHGGYIRRSNIQIDRDSYQAGGKVYDTHEVAVPDVVDASARLGYINKYVQVEGFIENMTSQSGDDIRRQDMPFPTNRMNQTSLGGMAKVHLYLKNGTFFSLFGQYGQVTAGRNVGQARMYTVGIQHTFSVTGQKIIM
ncbi:hypothetical protein QE390_000807 [Siphonobacter sp. SORGH_AS 1065]|nr:hypothetical protein [Siphonobacter sp. SORGH_AS_1065]